MTTNQIRYQEHLEEKRHHVATEAETSRANQEKEKIQRDYNTWFSGETTKHNRAQEDLAKQTLIVNDAHYQRQDAESQRHSLAMEQLQLSQQLEAQRHNLATEREANRHNTVSEAQTWQELAIDKIEANAREQQARASMQQAKASTMSAQAAMTKAQTDQSMAEHTQRLQRAEYVREGQWKAQQFDIEQQKADAATTQASASSTQASAAQWNSIDHSRLVDAQISNLRSQTNLNNTRAWETDVNTKLGIFDRAVDVARNIVKRFGGNDK